MHGALVSKTDELPLSASRLPGSLMVLGDGKSGDFLLAVPEKKKKTRRRRRRSAAGNQRGRDKVF